MVRGITKSNLNELSRLIVLCKAASIKRICWSIYWYDDEDHFNDWEAYDENGFIDNFDSVERKVVSRLDLDNELWDLSNILSDNSGTGVFEIDVDKGIAYRMGDADMSSPDLEYSGISNPVVYRFDFDQDSLDKAGLYSDVVGSKLNLRQNIIFEHDPKTRTEYVELSESEVVAIFKAVIGGTLPFPLYRKVEVELD